MEKCHESLALVRAQMLSRGKADERIENLPFTVTLVRHIWARRILLPAPVALAVGALIVKRRAAQARAV